jgi:hypothetical protein
VAIQVSQPQAGATLNGRESITLNARVEGDPQLRLLAGIDFTLRDGRVEEGSCPVDTERASQERRFLSSSIPLERALSKCPPDKTNDPNKARNALAGFQRRDYCEAGKFFSLTKERMRHILERHFLEYFNTNITKSQSYFPAETSIETVVNVIIPEVLRQNYEFIRNATPAQLNRGPTGNGLEGTVGGLMYRVYIGVGGSKIGSAFPVAGQAGICSIP